MYAHHTALEGEALFGRHACPNTSNAASQRGGLGGYVCEVPICIPRLLGSLIHLPARFRNRQMFSAVLLWSVELGLTYPSLVGLSPIRTKASLIHGGPCRPSNVKLRQPC